MILRLILRSIEMIRRSFNNLIFRPIYIIRNKFFRLFNVSRYISKMQQSIMKLPLAIKVKPDKREDYVDTGPFYLAKSMLAMIIIGAIAIPLLFYFIIWPLLVAYFFTANFYIKDPKVEDYSGKVRLYYEKEFENLAFKGTLKNGVKLDYGEEYYENGIASYKGNFKDDLYDKKGVTYDLQGAMIYDGDFVEGLYEGDGTLYFDDYLRYEGEFEKGNINGRGKYFSEDTLIFEGSFLLGKKDGRGTEYSPDTGKKLYEGMFLEDLYDGEGTKYYDSGEELYTGYFKKGKYNGEGVLKRKDGTKIYEGDFEEDLYNGEGTSFDEEQSIVYKGSFVNNLYEGTGILNVKPEKLRYEGTFVEGKMSGEGKLYKEGKLYYEGSFNEGMLSGKGKLTDNDAGFEYEGSFKYNDIDIRNLFEISTEEIYPLFTKGLEEADQENHTYLYNKKQGIVLNITFAQEETPSQLVAVYRLPIQSMAKEIKGKTNILPYEYRYKEKSSVSLPTDIKKLLNVDSKGTVCHVLEVDGMIVDYWTNEKTQAVVLIGYRPDPNADEKDFVGAEKSDKMAPEDIEALLKELGIQEEEAVKLGLIESSEQTTGTDSSEPQEKIQVDASLLAAIDKAVNRNEELLAIKKKLKQLNDQMEAKKINKEQDVSAELVSIASEMNALKNEYIDKKNELVCQVNQLLLDSEAANNKVKYYEEKLLSINDKVTKAKEDYKKGKLTLDEKEALEEELKDCATSLNLSKAKLSEYKASYQKVTGEELNTEEVVALQVFMDPTTLKWPSKKTVQPAMLFESIKDNIPEMPDNTVDLTDEMVNLIDEYKSIGDLAKQYVKLLGDEKKITEEVKKGQTSNSDLESIKEEIKVVKMNLDDIKAAYTKEIFEMVKLSRNTAFNDELGSQLFSDPINTPFNLGGNEELEDKGGRWIIYNQEGENVFKLEEAPIEVKNAKYFVIVCENNVLTEGKIGQPLKLNSPKIIQNTYAKISFYGTDKKVIASLIIDGTSNSGSLYSEGGN